MINNQLSQKEFEYYRTLAGEIRQEVLNMVYRTKSPHVGSCFSMIEILITLYFKILRINPELPHDEKRDRFILSKGHGCPALYAVLVKRGFLDKDHIDKFAVSGGCLEQHPTRDVKRGIEITSGSLGHGLSIGSGMALAGKCDRSDVRVFVFLGDGELDEGLNWEAAMFASHNKLDNLVAIVDYNKLQVLGKTADVLNLEPLGEKWRSFGWEVREVDGHNFEQLAACLGSVPFQQGKPSVVIAHTIKGKGVSFMENELCWHDKHPDDREYEKALDELKI